MKYKNILESEFAPKKRPKQNPLKQQLQKTQRQLYYLWDFIGQEGLWNEAKEYLEDNIDAPIPYEW